MKKFLKGALKFIGIYSAVTLVFYIIILRIMQWKYTTYEQFSLDALEQEVYVFCGIFYAYLGLRFIKKVMKKDLRIYYKMPIGIAFWAFGYLSTLIFPACAVFSLCDMAGYYLLEFGISVFGAEFELSSNANLFLAFLLLCISSVVFALMCYDAAENYYTGAYAKAKRENEQIQESKNNASEEK